MTERDIAVYAVVLDLIYDGGHQTLDDPKHIASYFSDVGSASVRRTIDRLIEAGKLVREGRFLTNKRAKNEGKTREELAVSRRKSGHLGGASSGKSRAKSNNANALSEASASSEVALDKIREDIEAKASCPKPASRISYPPEFEEVWKAYPTDKLMSKKDGFNAWRKLADDDRDLLAKSLAAFNAHCQSDPTYRPVHFVRYVTSRRFEGMADDSRPMQGRQRIEVNGRPTRDANGDLTRAALFGRG
ncbi:hypothetical protein [Mesorhizobium sp. NPDC059025]|uniref:hypothetical protein n=1 Tax=unclassified Mesorhizobium TaxID=325217 RepID=UPI00369E9E97